MKGALSSGAIIIIVIGVVAGFSFFTNSYKQPSTSSSSFCDDSDVDNLYIKGACEDKNDIYYDSCSGSFVNEYDCANNLCAPTQMSCPSGYVCSDGRCSLEFDFSLSASPSSSSVKSGQSVSSDLNIGLLREPAQRVTLSLSGCPTSATCTFSSVSSTAPFTSKLMISTIATPPGTYDITITGVSAGKSQSTIYKLTVTS